MAPKKTVLVVAALLLVALALEAAPPAAAMDCKAGCNKVSGPLGMTVEQCLKNCDAIAAEQGPNKDPYVTFKDAKWDIAA